MEKLLDIQNILFEKFERETTYQRDCFENIRFDNRITGIIGSRGVGKTTFLLQTAIEKGAKEGKAIYVTADNLYFLDNLLFEFVDQLYKETNIRFVCIDEIHKYSNWQQELKNIYDTYADMKILFTGSSMIDIIHGKYDLSRRVTLFQLYGLSFREYMAFAHDVSLPKVRFEELVRDHYKVAQSLNNMDLLKHFKTYSRVGYYPFFKMFPNELDTFQAIDNTTQKTIYEDIATLHNLKTPTLSLIEKLFKYTLSSMPGELSVNKLATALNKDFNNISDYLDLLEKAGLIRFLFSKQTGKAYLRRPTKIYPENTNLIFASLVSQAEDAMVGKLRETFVMNQIHNAGLEAYYSKTGDMVVEGVVLEIGGKSKTRKQIQGIDDAKLVVDGTLLGGKDSIPMFLMGLLN